MSEEAEQLAVRLIGQEDLQRHPGLARIVGKITDLSSDSITVEACDGSSITIKTPAERDPWRVGQNIEVGIAKDGADYTLLFGVPLSDNMDFDLYRQALKVSERYPQLMRPK